MNINKISEQPFLFARKQIKRLPQNLIYHFEKRDTYNMLNLKENKMVGFMSVDVRYIDNDEFYPNIKKSYKTFHICDFEVFDKLKGYGKMFIDFAKKESLRRNCKGRITLVAYNENKAPHVFYRKQGFTTNDPKINEQLDEAIKNFDTIEHMPLTYMYLMNEKMPKNIK